MFSSHRISILSACGTKIVVIIYFTIIWNIFIFVGRKVFIINTCFVTTSSRWSKWHMFSKIFSENTTGLRDRNKTTRMLRDLLSFSVDVTAIGAAHFVMTSKAYGYRQARQFRCWWSVTWAQRWTLSMSMCRASWSWPILSWNVLRIIAMFFLFFRLKGHCWWICLH